MPDRDGMIDLREHGEDNVWGPWAIQDYTVTRIARIEGSTNTSTGKATIAAATVDIPAWVEQVAVTGIAHVEHRHSTAQPADHSRLGVAVQIVNVGQSTTTGSYLRHDILKTADYAAVSASHSTSWDGSTSVIVRARSDWITVSNTSELKRHGSITAIVEMQNSTATI